MSDLAARIGPRKKYDANNNLGNARPRGDIKEVPVSDKSQSFIERGQHHVPSRQSNTTSLLDRLEPIYVDEADDRVDIVPLIDQTLELKDDHQPGESVLRMKDPVITGVSVPMTTHISAIENGSFVNIKNAALSSTKLSDEELSRELPMPRPQTPTQPLHSTPAPISQPNGLSLLERLGAAKNMSLSADSLPLPVFRDFSMEESGPSLTMFSQIKDALLPLVIQNAQARSTHAVNEMNFETIRDRANEILTDDACEAFVGRMHSIERQMQAYKLRGKETNSDSLLPSTALTVSNSGGMVSIAEASGNLSSLPNHPSPPASASLPNAPKAPKAMQLRDSTHNSLQSNPQKSPLFPSQKGKEKANPDEFPNEQIPRGPRNHTDSHVYHPQTTTQSSLNDREVRGSSGIATSVNPKRSERSAQGSPGNESKSTYFSSRYRSSSFGSHSSPPDRFDHSSRQRLVPSPEGYNPRIPESHHYNDRRHRSFNRSRSRSHSPDRPVSYKPGSMPRGREMKHSPVKGDIHRPLGYTPRSRSRSRPPRRPSRSPEHRGFDRFSNGVNHRKPHRPESRSHSRQVSRSPQFAHHPGYREDSSPSYTKNSRSSESPHGSRFLRAPNGDPFVNDNRERQHSGIDTIHNPLPPERMKTLSIQRPKQIKKLAQVMEPCRNVPGLWLIKMGEEDVRIIECELDINRETSLKWNLTNEAFPKLEGKFHVQPQRHLLSLRLMCVPTQVVRSTYETSSLGTATPEEVATTLIGLENEWPRKGSLVITANSHKAWGKTWLPIDLEPDGPALDLTTCVREGKNIIRFIQLADLAEKVFLLHATVTPPDSDEGEFWDLSKHLAMSPGPVKLHPAVVEVA